MKKRGMTYRFIVPVVLVLLFAQSPLVFAQPQSLSHPGCLFNLQFVTVVSWGNETDEPIAPGETREVRLSISSMVTHGAYGRILLHLLEGSTYQIHLTVVEKPEWCTAWTFVENLTAVIIPDEITTQDTLLSIHPADDAPGNYTLGWVKLRCAINEKRGPFNVFTLVQGYENVFTLTFCTSP